MSNLFTLKSTTQSASALKVIRRFFISLVVLSDTYMAEVHHYYSNVYLRLVAQLIVVALLYYEITVTVFIHTEGQRVIIPEKTPGRIVSEAEKTQVEEHLPGT